MKKICRHVQHRKDNFLSTDPWNECGCECAMRNAKYINPDGTIDPDVYAEACIETNYQYRKKNSIEFYPTKKGKKK